MASILYFRLSINAILAKYEVNDNTDRKINEISNKPFINKNKRAIDIFFTSKKYFKFKLINLCLLQSND